MYQGGLTVADDANRKNLEAQRATRGESRASASCRPVRTALS